MATKIKVTKLIPTKSTHSWDVLPNTSYPRPSMNSRGINNNRVDQPFLSLLHRKYSSNSDSSRPSDVKFARVTLPIISASRAETAGPRFSAFLERGNGNCKCQDLRAPIRLDNSTAMGFLEITRVQTIARCCVHRLGDACTEASIISLADNDDRQFAPIERRMLITRKTLLRVAS